MKLHRNFFSLLTIGLAISLAECAQIDKENTAANNNPVISTPGGSTPAVIDPTLVSFTAASTQVTVGWTNSTNGDSGVKIMRTIGSPPADCSGTAICTGSACNATLTMGAAGRTYVDGALTNGTQYFYRVCANHTGGNLSPGITGSATPAIIDITAPANPGAVTLTPGSTQITVGWNNPADGDFAGVKIVKATGGTAPTDCSGAALCSGTACNANVTAGASGLTYVDTGLINGTQYFYRLCSYDGVPNYSTGATGSATAALIEGLYLADTVTEAPGHTGVGNYNSAGITNGVRGGGAGGGATSGLFSLENAPAGASTHIVIRWSGKKVKNGPGADFAVFENAFNISGNPATRFMDLALVEVSNDNINYCGFAPDYTNATETTYSNNPANWSRFAGRAPVIYNVDVPATNFTAAQLFQDNDTNYEGDLGGGDLFDLDQLSDSNYYNTGCTTLLRDELKANGFTYLKLVPAKKRLNPDTGALFVADGVSSGPDFDGVVARYVQ